MAVLFCHADDLHDAVSAAVGAINARLSRRGLQLEPSDAEALREALVDALELAEVVEVQE